MGAAYLSVRNFDKGIALLKNALEIAPNDFVSLMNLGRAFRDKGDKPGARTYLQLAVDNASDDEEKAQAAKFLDSVR